MNQYVWSDGPSLVEGSGGALGLVLNRTFLDVYHIAFPHPEDVVSFSEGLLNSNAISYCRVDYKQALAAFVITSTLPKGRREADDFSALLELEMATSGAYAIQDKGHRYSVSLGRSPWGETINVRTSNVTDGTDLAPFPLVRNLLVDDDPLFSISFHRLFVRGTNRYEIAVLGAPPRDGNESVGEWEKGLESMADKMVSTLQVGTERMLRAKGSLDD